MDEELINTPIIIVGIIIGVDIVLRVLDKVNKIKNKIPTQHTGEIIPKKLIKQTEDIYWKTADIYRHVWESEKMLEKVREKLPQGFDKIAELMQEMLLELKKISKEMQEPKPSGD